jgi:hydrogenase maturation protease
MAAAKILVLGVGNILMSDEGAGVYAVRKLEKQSIFSENVTLLDGGTLGMRLLHPISCADVLIVADTAMRGLKPGTISRLNISDVCPGLTLKNSMHQLSFSETLAMAQLMGVLPETVIIAIEPADITSMSTECTPEVASGIDEMCLRLLSEVSSYGGTYKAI